MAKLRDKDMVLILDNFESVACADVVDFLRQLLTETEHVRLLVTSDSAVGLDTMDMSVETQLLLDEGAGDDPWWMSIEVIGVLTGGDRVTLRQADRPTKVGGDDPTLVRWDLR